MKFLAVGVLAILLLFSVVGLNESQSQIPTQGPLYTQNTPHILSSFATIGGGTKAHVTLPSGTTTKPPADLRCVLPSGAASPNSSTNPVSSDACLPGPKSTKCKTWRMTNAVILKNKENVSANCATIAEYVNNTTSKCDSKSKIQYIFPTNDTTDHCTIFSFKSILIQQAIDSFDYSRTLIPSQAPGREMNDFFRKIVECVDAIQVFETDGAILNIFTDLTYNEMCSIQNFMSSFSDNLRTLIGKGYVVKFFFLGQFLGINYKYAEKVLQGCSYNKDNAYCEIIDAARAGEFTAFEICTEDPATDKKDGGAINWQLIMIIAIPSLSLTVCCIAFFVCCLKCAKLKIAMYRLRLFGHDRGLTDEEMKLRKKWLAKKKKMDELEDGKGGRHSHYATANNYMDIEAMANANKKDVWEIDTKNLLVQEDHLLGNGAFANVFKGIVKGKIPLLIVNNSLKLSIESEQNGHYEAAVKKLPAHADEQNHLDFFHEIEFMKRLGHHPHVISMLGCISNPYEPLIVVEYAGRGDLLKFLRRHKDYVLLNKQDECPIEADMCLRIKDLVSIAWQVADGMAYLTSKNFIHRDLAARNVLLTKSLTAKISDFGLCRYMDEALYTAKGGRLPIKWMSIEALKLYEFSSKSDVWSFGVLLYEIFSMGDVPYPTVQQVDMLDHLLSGGRLGQPIKCPNEIYNIMERCWAENPDDRPEFNEMRTEITTMLNLDDESYGYLSVQSEGEGPRYTSLTMQDSKQDDEPTCSTYTSQDNDNDSYDESTRCERLNEAMRERFGAEQASEIKKLFCEVFPPPASLKKNRSNVSVMNTSH